MADFQFTTEELGAEEWRSIIEFEGIYSVSNLGRVRRDVTHGGRPSGRLLKTRSWGRRTMPYAVLGNRGVNTRCQLASLVASAFLGTCPAGEVVGYKDGDSCNTRATNLNYIAKEFAKGQYPKQTCRSCRLEKSPSHFVKVCKYNQCRDCRSGETTSRRAREMHQLMAQKPEVIDVRGFYDRRHDKKARRKRRDMVLKVYGGACQCCGETQYEFLAIDHIEGNGNEHRREMNSQNIAPWLIKNDFPEGFQVLCHNCNIAKGFYGACPHAIQRVELFQSARELAIAS